MACRYYNGLTKKYINSEQALIKEFLKQNYQLKNAAIFSSEEIQSSTVNKILAIPGVNNYEAYNKESNFVKVTDFITQKNTEFFDAITGLKGQDRLSPKYILENRIYEYVSKHLEEAPNVIDTSTLKITDSLFKDLKNRPLLKDVSDAKIMYLLNEVEEIIAHEEKVKSFGILLHELISANIKGDTTRYNSLFNAFFKNENNKEIIGEYDYMQWKNKISQLIADVKTSVFKYGTPISEIFITSDKNAPAQVKGKIDLIAVDTNGNAHIFEIKISKTKYSDWDSAKELTLDWQLALYRQLLGQYIDVNDIILNTIPIHMPTLGNPNMIYLEGTKSRNTEFNSRLGSTGRLTTIANKLIPRKIIVDYDPQRKDKLLNTLHDILGNYEIKTDAEDINVDVMVEKARKNFNETGKWKKWNKFEGNELLPEKYIEADTEEEFREKLLIYSGLLKNNMTANVSSLKNAIINALKTDGEIKVSKNEQLNIAINKVLNGYNNAEWEVIDNIPEAIPFGLILIRNQKTGVLNVISVTTSQFLADSKEMSGMNYGDLEYMKTFIFLNEFKKELFPSLNDKLGEIILYNPIKDAMPTYYQPTLKEFRNFQKLVSPKELTIALNEQNILGIEDVALLNLNSSIRYYSGSRKEEIQGIFRPIENVDLTSIEIDTLLKIQKELFEQFPEYRARSISPEINFNDEKEMLFATLQVAIITKRQSDISGDFQNMSEFGLEFSNFKSLISALWTKNQAEFDKTGRRIQGLVQSLAWTTPDSVRALDLRNINKMMATGNQHVGELMLKESSILNKYTKELYDKIGFSQAERILWGETQKKHQNFWKRDKDGNISIEFKTKNPYLQDLDNAMEDYERDYLKKYLLHINRWMLNLSTSEFEQIDPNNYNSLISNEKVKKAIEDGSYFEMPMIRREEYTKYQGFFSTPGQIWNEKIKAYSDEINDYFDDRGLRKEDITNADKENIGYYEMYDIYGAQTKSYKAKAIEKHGLNYFDFNLDTIAHRVAFNKIRKNVMDQILPILNSYLWWLKLMGAKQGVNLSKQFEYIVNQMKLSIYDQPIVDEEFKDVTTAVAIARQISTASMLAFRIPLAVKELTIGVMRNVTLAMTNMQEGQFKTKDLLEAYTKLATIDKQFSTEFNMINRLNHMYRFANMDINTAAKKLQSDRGGIVRGLGRWMYTTSTIGDFYNRMGVFLARMIADGSYEAHSMVNNELVYDPKKDKRFSYYLENRDKYKDSQGRFIPAKNDEKYNKQRQHYLLVMNQINEEWIGDKQFKRLTESDMLYKAYSEKERSSIKSFTDMVFGYYDKDAQSQSHNKWWGIALMQFMQFWPGKMKMWFGKPTKEGPTGHFEQAWREDKDGNKILLWKKPILDESGEYTYDKYGNMLFETADENTGDPLLIWVGDPFEGLAYSVLYTIQDLARLDFKSIMNNKGRRNRVMFALADGVFLFIMLAILKALFDNYIKDNGTDGVDGELIKFMSVVEKKVLNEYNVYNNTLGAINTEPVFLSWGKRFAQDLGDTVQGNRTIQSALGRNVGALEFLKD